MIFYDLWERMCVEWLAVILKSEKNWREQYAKSEQSIKRRNEWLTRNLI